MDIEAEWYFTVIVLDGRIIGMTMVNNFKKEQANKKVDSQYEPSMFTDLFFLSVELLYSNVGLLTFGIPIPCYPMGTPDASSTILKCSENGMHDYKHPMLLYIPRWCWMLDLLGIRCTNPWCDSGK